MKGRAVRWPWICIALLFSGPGRAAEWPTVRGNNLRNGYTDDCVEPPYQRKWVRFWPREILATRVEAIVAGGKVFAGTLSGRLHALDAETGEEAWTFQADGPILHSPACSSGQVTFATASPGRTVYSLSAADGSVKFATPCGEGGFAASPLVEGGLVLVGGRDGVFHAIDGAKGAILWTFPTGGPIRNTAAAAQDRVLFASEDMHAYALELRGGKLLWKSEKMYGQSLRDYYPVVLGESVVFRTNPMEQMGVHLGRTYGLVGRNAGIDMSTWQNVDAFVKSEKARGSPDLFEKEERAVLEYLESHPQARTFYALDPGTGKEKVRAPVLWGAGCQGVGIPPVSDGKGGAVVFTRTAYGNWTLGVAPMVGLQLLDLAGDPRPPEASLGPFPTARTVPLFHSKGNQPPWNTFWGTADETTNYSVGGRILYPTHQGTLSAFDLRDRSLFTIWGKRDTWGGEKSLPWARNEWHGPARGSVAISGDSLYWVTGSRIIAIRGKSAAGGKEKQASGEGPGKAALDRASETNQASIPSADDLLRYVRERASVSAVDVRAGADLLRELKKRVAEVLEKPDLAPLLVEIGLGSHDFFFKTSAETVTALALAYPYVPAELQAKVKERVRREIAEHPLCGPESRYPLDGGERRELYTITSERFFLGWEEPRPIAEAYALDLYGARTGDWEAVRGLWPRAKKAFEDLGGWKLDVERGDRFQNGTIAGLIAVSRLAARFGDSDTAHAAERRAAEELRRLLDHWQRGVRGLPTAQEIENVTEVDRFIGKGNPLFFAVAPHRHKIAKFLDLSAEVGRAVREVLPDSTRAYLEYVDLVLPTWYLAWEERQVHFGENYIDFPDQALSIFRAKRFLGAADSAGLRRAIDIPWCRGDLHYIEKLVLALEATGKEEWRAP